MKALTSTGERTFQPCPVVLQVSVRRSRLVSHFSSLKCPWKSILSIDRNYKIEFQIEFPRKKWGYEPYDLYVRISWSNPLPRWFSSVSHFLSIKCLGKSILSIDFSSHFSSEKRKVRLQNEAIRWSNPLNRSVTKKGSVFPALTSAEFLRFDLARGFPYHLGGLGGGWRPPPNDEWPAHASYEILIGFGLHLTMRTTQRGRGYAKVNFTRLIKSSLQVFRWQ